MQVYIGIVHFMAFSPDFYVLLALTTAVDLMGEISTLKLITAFIRVITTTKRRSRPVVSLHHVEAQFIRSKTMDDSAEVGGAAGWPAWHTSAKRESTAYRS